MLTCLHEWREHFHRIIFTAAVSNKEDQNVQTEAVEVKDQQIHTAAVIAQETGVLPL